MAPEVERNDIWSKQVWVDTFRGLSHEWRPSHVHTPNSLRASHPRGLPTVLNCLVSAPYRMAQLQKVSLAALSEVQASSEAVGHPILLAFDEGMGPGATYWKAGDPGQQTITVTFREPCTLSQVTMEVEEREVARTQEVQLALSTDGGSNYRELIRQEFNFSPDGASWEHESWAVPQYQVTHVRLVIKPDKGRVDVYATLTSLGLWQLV